MRVLVVANGIPSGAKALDGIFELDQAKALRDNGVDVIFFAIDLRSIRRKRTLGISSGIKDGIKWYRIAIPLGRIPLRLLCLIGALGFKILYKRVFSIEKEPDIIHAHFTEQGFMATYWETSSKIPVVMTEHSSRIMKNPISSDLYKIGYETYHRVLRLITVGDSLSKKIGDYFGVDNIVIPNIIDVGLFGKNVQTKHEGFNLVTVAGLIERKRINLLINAIYKIKARIPQINLHIIGDGPERHKLKTLSVNYGLESNIHFYGSLTRREINKIFSICDCFALVSSEETFGVVYVEAMASGMPVIASRCGGPENFVNLNNGILVDVDDEGQTVDAIEYMYENIHKYNREEIMKFVAENYSPQSVSSKIIKVYHSILS